MIVTLIAVVLALTAFLAAMAARNWFHRQLRHGTVVHSLVVAGTIAILGLSLLLSLSLFEHREIVLGTVVITILAGALSMISASSRCTTIAPNRRRVLVVAAHPDDIELAAGGTVGRLKDRGHEVRAVVMSDGAQGGDARVRGQEARTGAQFLGIEHVDLHRFTDTKLADDMSPMVSSIEAAIELHEPEIILTHSGNDQHQDHHAVYLATLRAGRRVPTILCFESPSATAEFTPRFFVDIGDHLEVKVASVKRHADQAGKPYMGRELIEGMAVTRGAQARTRHAEGFEIVRALSTTLGDL